MKLLDAVGGALVGLIMAHLYKHKWPKTPPKSSGSRNAMPKKGSVCESSWSIEFETATTKVHLPQVPEPAQKFR